MMEGMALLRAFFTLLLLGGLISVGAGGSAGRAGAAVHASTSKAVQSAGDPVIATAGDIACDPGNPDYAGGNGTATTCRQKSTAPLLAGVDAVLPLGDEQYESGALSAFQVSYNGSWGPYNSIVHPVPGNHEYMKPAASGYYAYFGAAAGDPTKGYYSWDLGAWHLVALNSECAEVGGCNAGSPQELWLQADLAATSKQCILAYWHKPRFSSGEHGPNAAYDAFWRDLYAAGADIALSGHDHDYERFAPQNPDGQVDANGIRQFVVGTGGAILIYFGEIQPNTEIRNRMTYGVLKLTLHATSYDWQFVPEGSGTFTDSGSRSCAAPTTAVGVREITALNARTGIRIRWRTAGETRLIGFSVYRDRDGKRTELSRRVIPAIGGTAGKTYSWLDSDPPHGKLRYWVETIGVDGHRRLIGPAAVAR